MSQITDYYQDGSTPEEIAFLTGLRTETIIEHLRNQGELERQAKPRDESLPVTRVDVTRSNLEAVCQTIAAIIFAEGEQVVMIDERRFVNCYAGKGDTGKRLKRGCTPNHVGAYDVVHTRDDLKEDIVFCLDELRGLRNKLVKAERKW